jgi:hypothetical protein
MVLADVKAKFQNIIKYTISAAMLVIVLLTIMEVLSSPAQAPEINHEAQAEQIQRELNAVEKQQEILNLKLQANELDQKLNELEKAYEQGDNNQ